MLLRSDYENCSKNREIIAERAFLSGTILVREPVTGSITARDVLPRNLPLEWRSLGPAARADKTAMGVIRQRYPNLNEESQVEEAVAERFARWRAGDKERGFVAKAFERVQNVFRAIGEALRGGGFKTADSVMQAMAAGEIGTRAISSAATNVAAKDVVARTKRSRTGGFAGPFAKSGGEPSSVQRSRDELEAIRSLSDAEPESAIGGTRFDRWRTRLQDRMLPLVRTRQTVERDLGRPLDERENPYIGEELMTGRVGAQLERLADDMVGPLFEASV